MEVKTIDHEGFKPYIVGVMTTQFSEIYINAGSQAEAKILAKEYWRVHMTERPNEPAHRIVDIKHVVGPEFH